MQWTKEEQDFFYANQKEILDLVREKKEDKAFFDKIKKREKEVRKFLSELKTKKSKTKTKSESITQIKNQVIDSQDDGLNGKKHKKLKTFPKKNKNRLK